MIEKQVHYQLLRGWSLTAAYQIIGGFQADLNGETVLRYGVSGQPGVPFFQAGFNLTWLLLITLMLGAFVFSPTIGGHPIGILLLVMVATMILYSWFAYRSYQGHLKELKRFMQAFAQQEG